MLNSKRVKILLILAVACLPVLGSYASSHEGEVLAQTDPQTVTFRISGVSDIALEDGSDTRIGGCFGWVGSGYAGQASRAGLRFSGAAIPAGMVITNAVVEFTSPRAQTNLPSVKVFAERSISPATYSETNLPSSRQLTSAYVSLGATPWNRLTKVSLDVTPLINEVVNNNPNSSVSGINIVVSPDQNIQFSRVFFWNDLTDSSTLPVLKVTYQVPATSSSSSSTTSNSSSSSSAANAINLYVSNSGNDTSGDGSLQNPYRTIQKGVNQAKTNLAKQVVLNVQPGVYREQVTISGAKFQPLAGLDIRATQGKNSVFVMGSETSTDPRLSWVKSTGGLSFPGSAQGHIYYADISVWNAAPEIAVWANADYSSLNRLPKSMEPDFDVWSSTEVSDPRFVADGNNVGSQNSLVDGQLSSLFTSSTNLVGARLLTKDAYSAHDHNTAIVTAYNPSNGQLTIDKNLTYYTGKPLIDSGARYYLEGRPEFVDTAGEWIYDASTKRIYIWSPNEDSPAKIDIEFAVRNVGFQIDGSSNVTLTNLNVYFTNNIYSRSTGNDGAVRIANSASESSNNITLEGLKIRHSGVGVRIFQDSNSGNKTQNTHLNDVQIDHTDGLSLTAFNFPYLDGSGNFIQGVVGLTVENSQFAYGGYRSAGAGFMLWMQEIQKVLFQNNLVQYAFHNGIEIQGGYDSNVLVRNNYFANNCTNGSDCAGFKVWASGKKVRNILVMDNISRDNQGCSDVNATSTSWSTSRGDRCAGFGYYTDYVSPLNPAETGLIFYHNLAYNNYNAAVQFTKSSKVSAIANVFLNNPVGISVTTTTTATQRLEGAVVSKNIFAATDNNLPRAVSFFGTAVKLYTEGWNIPLESSADVAALTVNQNKYQMQGVGAIDGYHRQISTFSTQQYLQQVSNIKQQLGWENSGVDVSGVTYQIGSGYGLSTNSLESGFGIDINPTDSELKRMITDLQSKLGVTITPQSWVGLK